MAAERLVLFGDHEEKRETFADALRLNGFDVVEVDRLRQVESEIESPHFSLLIYVGNGKESLRECQRLADRHEHVAVLYILDQTVTNIETSDHRRVCTPQTAQPRLFETIHNLIQLGNLHKRIYQLTKMASGSTSVDQMFTKLDVHHILDRMLAYFASRMDLKNIHWIRWQDLPHVLQTEKTVLALEMDVFEARSPRVMSFHNSDLSKLFQNLSSQLGAYELSEKAQLGHWVGTFEGESVLLVPVPALNGPTPLGLLIFEGLEASEQEKFAPQIIETLRLMARFVEFGLSHWDSKTLAMTDDLTQLYNQRFLPTVLDNEINRAQRRQSEFSVLFMDLDYFKTVNDTKGHWIGSKLLKEVSEVLKRCIRSCDFAFRYGGDEFVVILPDTNIQGGQIVAERIRQSVESSVFLIEGHEMRLTVSVGLAGYPQHALTRADIIQLADQAMYYGKRKSRNIVYVAS